MDQKYKINIFQKIKRKLIKKGKINKRKEKNKTKKSRTTRPPNVTIGPLKRFFLLKRQPQIYNLYMHMNKQNIKYW